MCWVALSVGASLAREVMHDDLKAAAWLTAAQEVEAAVWAQQKASTFPYFTQGLHHPQMDAALLTLGIYGLVPIDHPVFVQTVQQIEKDLVEKDMVFRYRKDNMGEAKYAFTLAGFWLARVYLRMGQPDRANDLIAAQISCATTLGLFSEHTDPVSKEPHGNFPQLFPHAALITSLMELQRAQQGHPPGFEKDFLKSLSGISSSSPHPA
jgi:GH15 family glucan-1,4-alpha-glucosidase